MRGTRSYRTLGNYDRDGDASPQARQARAALRRDNRELSTRRGVLAGDGCWCGEAFGHDWPGKDKGTAHPR
jgi:hypothetical protein